MRPADSLRRRIVVAFLMFGVLMSLLFAAVAAVAIEGIETRLVDERLADAAAWALPRAAAGLPTDLPAGLHFYRDQAIPLALRALPAGVTDVDVEGAGLKVLSGQDAAGRYAVVDRESDYDTVELVVYSMFAACFLGCMALAAGLGMVVARRVVAPIAALAAAVGTPAGAPAVALPLTGRQDELGVLARALERHTAELRAFLERERLFTGDVSHELRTPLTVIMGAAEILVVQAENQASRAPAERIYRAAQEAAERVTVLLLLARTPDIGAMPAVSLNAIAGRELERYRPLVGDRPLRLRYVEGPALAVRAPAELCATAIGNLVRNACEYTVRGEVVVSFAPGQLIVEDTGPGLPAAVRATLGRHDCVVPSRGSAGTGLGLALVSRICEYLGAALHYESGAAGGSRFTITFAAVAADFTQADFT
jgi:signal transduction histidine kinase